ncbi:hypothetical protein GKZ28_14645 [Clostridium chromiireducens]|uniref:Uncharacterized protein n=1 Tax=Clostridium chromiireducens TaxID=225345 RepID=A0A964RNJ2_9CLOT|nr:hypothetical protein [Clostridium chromiireducens]MVX64931.1 hypothetical protein [Clostridium chromiireducens]
MTEKARREKKAYMKEWRKKNKDKVKATQDRYWERGLGYMDKDNTTVKVESFEDIRKEQEKRLESIKEWNAAMNGNKYQPTVAEEMNLIGDPDFRYVGKGSLF